MGTKKKLGLLLLGCAILASLRLIHLGADTPLGIGSGSMAPYVDEGYKTLSPRNLVLFGSVRWNPGDNYRGWMSASPITQWTYYLAFRIFGPELISARAVTVAVFFVFLVVFCWAMVDRYPLGLLLLGLFLLGLLHVWFFFSRLALFELPLAVCLYVVLFVLRKFERVDVWVGAALIAAATIIATLGIKRSALLYFFLLGVGWIVARALGGRNEARSAGALVGLLAGLGVLVWVFEGAWSHRVGGLPVEWLRSVLQNPLGRSSAFLVCAGLICAFHSLATAPRRQLGDPYRAALLMLMVGGPIVLAIFRYQPLRYYVPLIPSYLLFVLEWLDQRSWRLALGRRAPGAAVGVFLLAWAVGYCGDAVNALAAAGDGWRFGGAAGPADPLRLVMLLPLALVMGLGLWYFRRAVLEGRRVLWLVLAVLTLATAWDVLWVGRFLAAPSYRSREITREIASRVPANASIGGDWAPFLTLGTPLRALYMSMVHNPPRTILRTRPEYLLESEAPSMRSTVSVIDGLDGVSVGAPIYSSSYVGRRVTLHPLQYED